MMSIVLLCKELRICQSNVLLPWCFDSTSKDSYMSYVPSCSLGNVFLNGQMKI